MAVTRKAGMYALLFDNGFRCLLHKWNGTITRSVGYHYACVCTLSVSVCIQRYLCVCVCVCLVDR